MNRIKKIGCVITFSIASAFLAQSTFASVDGQMVERAFQAPDAQKIIRDHNQRIANIDSEIRQVTDLINQYARFQNRLDSMRMNSALKADMKRVMGEEIDRYWEIHSKLMEIRQLLESRPSFNVRHDFN